MTSVTPRDENRMVCPARPGAGPVRVRHRGPSPPVGRTRRRPRERAWRTCWSAGASRFRASWSGRWPTWHSCPPSTWLRFTPSPEAAAAMPRRSGDEFGAVALQIRRQRSGRRLRRTADPPSSMHWPDVSAIGSIPCSPTPWSSRDTGAPASGGPMRIRSEIPPPPALPARYPDHPGRRPERCGGSADRSVAERLLEEGMPAAATTDDAPAHRRPPAVRGLGRCVRPPPDRGHAGLDPPARSRAPDRGMPAAGQRTIRDMVFGILPASQRERFEEEKELDTSHSIAGVGPVPGERRPATWDRHRGTPADSPRDARLRTSGCPIRSGPSPICGVDWCS